MVNFIGARGNQCTVHLAIEGNQTLLVATGTDNIGKTKNLNI